MENESTIWAMKLVDGEEIIAKVAELSSEEWSLTDARALLMTPDGNMFPAPLIFSAAEDSKMYIDPKNILVRTKKFREGFLEKYQASVSKLVLPTKQILHG
ncbi:Uncharacterised protein [uncultured archaeon]|nr:Uncharacterised protein [uncultured archaeon]